MTTRPPPANAGGFPGAPGAGIFDTPRALRGAGKDGTVETTQSARPRARFTVVEHTCGWCGERIDGEHPELHVYTCPKHPLACYRDAYAGLFEEVIRIGKATAEIAPQTAADLLHAAQIAFDKVQHLPHAAEWTELHGQPHPNGDDRTSLSLRALRRRNIATAAASNRQPTPTERQDTTGAAQ